MISFHFRGKVFHSKKLVIWIDPAPTQFCIKSKYIEVFFEKHNCGKIIMDNKIFVFKKIYIQYYKDYNFQRTLKKNTKKYFRFKL